MRNYQVFVVGNYSHNINPATNNLTDLRGGGNLTLVGPPSDQIVNVNVSTVGYSKLSQLHYISNMIIGFIYD